MTTLNQVRNAIEEVFGNYISEDKAKARDIINKATFRGNEDPGEWAPTSEVVIHTESGIPNGLYDCRTLEMWCAVSDRLNGMFCEHVNGGVIAVYRDY
jgi:hypothetical protein